MSPKLTTKLFRQDTKFITGFADTNHFPNIYLPQIAFLGKSNVGKSSLVNNVCRRKSLAYVSRTPGRTQQINYFSIGEQLIIVDLPGYGFAKLPLKQKNYWEKLIVFYLDNTPSLIMINLLIDARRGIKDHDITAMNFLHRYEKHFQIVLTKMDKINKSEIVLDTRNILEQLGYSCNIVTTSSAKKIGIKELQNSMINSINNSYDASKQN